MTDHQIEMQMLAGRVWNAHGDPFELAECLPDPGEDRERLVWPVVTPVLSEAAQRLSTLLAESFQFQASSKSFGP